MAALRLRDVHVSYAGRPPVLRGVDLEVREGEVVVLSGPSGSGKSSLLAVAAGLEAPQRGEVEVLGAPMPRDPDEAAGRRRGIGIVFQHLNLLGELSVAENVELPLRLRRAPRDARRARVNELLHRFGLLDLADEPPERLSGGEQQRTAIARALATRPGLVLVDEPTSALDDANARDVARALRAAAQDGAGVLVATHDPRLVRTGRWVRIDGGRVLQGPAAATAGGSAAGGPPRAAFEERTGHDHDGGGAPRP